MASHSIGTLYAYASGNDHGRYSCTLSYDTPTRSGGVVTLPNAKVVLTRYSTGWTSNRIAGRAGIGGSTTNVKNNVTLNSYGTESPASITFNLGSPTVSTLGNSFSFYVALASTGKSGDWTNFQGNSPLEYSITISCPAGKPTFTTNPRIADIQETSFKIVQGAVNVDSDFSFSISPSTGVTVTQTSEGATCTNLTPGTSYTITQTAVTKNSGGGADYTTTATASGSTYKYPYLESIGVSSLTLGGTQTAKIYNPLNRSVDFRVLKSDQSTVLLSAQSNKDSASLLIPINETFAGLIASAATESTVYYDIKYNDNISAKQSGKINITSDLANPQWTPGTTDTNLILYENTLATATTVIGNNQGLVQGKSTWKYKIDFSGYPAKPRYNATIVAYEVSVNGGAYASYATSGTFVTQAANTTTGSSVIIRVRAKDSRNFYSSIIERIIPVTPYSKPTGSLTVKRKDGYGDRVQIIISPTWAVNQNTNVGTATWSYKEVITNTWTDPSVGKNISTFNTAIEPTLDFSNNSSWDFKVVLTDKFGESSEIISTRIGPGIPIIFMDATVQGLGVNTYPSEAGIAVVGMTETTYAKVNKSITLGSNSRIEDYDNGTKTGVFWIGD